MQYQIILLIIRQKIRYTISSMQGVLLHIPQVGAQARAQDNLFQNKGFRTTVRIHQQFVKCFHLMLEFKHFKPIHSTTIWLHALCVFVHNFLLSPL